MADEKLRIILEAEADKALGPLKQVGEQLNKTGAAAGKFNRSLAGTNTTLTNFGRVLQDAPFGLIGIANNIDPLLSSFQQLKRESGSAGSALKALGAGLLGPAGIAIGVSAVTSALIAFGPQIEEAIFKVSAFDKAQREAGQKGAEAYKKSILEFERLSGIINDGNVSVVRQRQAFDEANSALGKYGLQVNSLAEFQKNGVEIGLLYAEIKKLEARSAVLASKSAEAYADRVAINTELQNNDNLSLLKRISNFNLLAVATGNVGAGLLDIKTQTENLKSTEAALDKENENLQESINAVISALRAVPGVADKSGKATKDAANATRESTKDYFQELSITEKVTRQTDALTLALQKLRGERAKQDIDAQARIVDSVISGNQLAPLDLAKSLTLPSGISEQLGAFNEQLSAADIKAANITTAFGLLTPAIDQAFAAIANGQNAFDAIGQALKRLIVDLVKAAALAAVLAAVTGGTGAGFGGAFLSNLKGLLSFRANGGPISGPTIVGERGKELFIPNTSGSIVSNLNLRSGDGGGTLTARIAGNDLLILLDRAQRQRGRLGG